MGKAKSSMNIDFFMCVKAESFARKLLKPIFVCVCVRVVCAYVYVYVYV